MIDQYIRYTKTKMTQAIAHFEQELGSVRGSRASASLLDGVKVDVYGQQMPLKQIANVTTPDARTILVQPWDRGNLPMIEKAIRENQALGLNPATDGLMVKINIPPMTEERRTQLAKLLGEKAEGAKVSLRNARHDGMDQAKRALKDKQITEDDSRRLEKELNKLIEDFQKQADALLQQKQSEIMEI